MEKQQTAVKFLQPRCKISTPILSRPEGGVVGRESSGNPSKPSMSLPLNPETAASALERDGFVVIPNALSPHLADSLRAEVDACLEQTLAGLAHGSIPHNKAVFGATAPPAQAVACRWNLLLPLDGPTLDAVRCVVAVTRGIFELACGRDAVLCDLSALIADPGSIAQRLHFDTRWSDAGSDAGRDDFMENDEFSADSNFVAGEEFVEDGELDTQLETSKQRADCRIAGQKRLVTAFVALQDVTEAMGPTFIAPGTANQASHNTLLAANGEGEIVEVLDSLMPGGVHMTIAGNLCTDGFSRIPPWGRQYI